MADRTQLKEILESEFKKWRLGLAASIAPIAIVLTKINNFSEMSIYAKTSLTISMLLLLISTGCFYVITVVTQREIRSVLSYSESRLKNLIEEYDKEIDKLSDIAVITGSIGYLLVITFIIFVIWGI